MINQPFYQSVIIFSSSLILLGSYSFFSKVQKIESHQSKPIKTVSKVNLQSSQIEFNFADELTEGKLSNVSVKFNVSNASNIAEGYILSFNDQSYLGEEIINSIPVTINNSRSIEKEILFTSPGKKQILLKDQKGTTLKKTTVNVIPFKASVFPKEWDKNKNLSQDNPSNWHIWVNLFSEPENKNGQRQYLQIEYKQEIIDRFLVSSGAKGHPTPQGTFKLGFKEEYPRSRRYNNTPMPFWSAINVNGNEGEYGFHSLDNGNYLYLLGKPASHGCIRLSRLPSVEKDPSTGKAFWGDRGGARWLYDRVPKETGITIFSNKLSEFSFEDYSAYLQKKALDYQKKKKTRKNRS